MRFSHYSQPFQVYSRSIIRHNLCGPLFSRALDVFVIKIHPFGSRRTLVIFEGVVEYG